MPSPLRRRQFKKFFDCIAGLMELQLLNACKCSLRDFVNYVLHNKVNIECPSVILRIMKFCFHLCRSLFSTPVDLNLLKILERSYV